jgi:hypothetical protein
MNIRDELLELLATATGPIDDDEASNAISLLALQEQVRRLRADVLHANVTRDTYVRIADHWTQRAQWAEAQLAKAGLPHREDDRSAAPSAPRSEPPP